MDTFLVPFWYFSMLNDPPHKGKFAGPNGVHYRGVYYRGDHCNYKKLDIKK